MICFKLQDSKTNVVSSTASATIMQLVLNIFDRVSEEDGQDKHFKDSKPSLFVDLEDGTSVPVGPCAFAAHYLFSDILVLASNQKPLNLQFIKIQSLSRISSLELIGSSLSNHQQLFKSHKSLLYLVQKKLYPLLIDLLNDKNNLNFPISIRLFQILQILANSFYIELNAECLYIWRALIDVIQFDNRLWMKTIGLEVCQFLCNNIQIIEHIYRSYNDEIFLPFLTALNRFLSDKNSIIGTNSDMSGLGTRQLPRDLSRQSGQFDASSYSYVGEVAAMVGAATTGVNGLNSNKSPKLSVTDVIKIKVIDQKDKSDAPLINEVYPLFVSVQVLISICEKLCNVIKTKNNQTDKFKLINEENDQIQTIKSMLDIGWPPILASLSRFISGEIDDELFIIGIKTAEDMAITSGLLCLTTPRDAFLGLIYRLACPTLVVTATMKWNEHQVYNGRENEQSPITVSSPQVETLNSPTLPISSYPPPRLSNRNHICLGIIITLSRKLSELLNGSWYEVIETLQNASYVLKSQLEFERKQKQFIPITEQNQASKTDFFGLNNNTLTQNTADANVLFKAIQSVFEDSVHLEKASLEWFVYALCRLCTGDNSSIKDSNNNDDQSSLSSSRRTSIEVYSPSMPSLLNRRTSGGYSRFNENTFAIEKIDVVGKLNVKKLIQGEAVSDDIICKNKLILKLISNNKLKPHIIERMVRYNR